MELKTSLELMNQIILEQKAEINCLESQIDYWEKSYESLLNSLRDAEKEIGKLSNRLEQMKNCRTITKYVYR